MIKKLIDEYVSLNFDRYHTPGHGGQLCATDITELDNGDYFPANSVEVAQSECAEIFGCKSLRFLVNGSSIGVKASIMAVGADIISAQNSHVAVQEGADLARVNNFIVKNNTLNDLPAPLTIQQISDAITAYPTAKAVVITSPDYYGQCYDTSVADFISSKGKILIADSAHGAHFAGSEQLQSKSFASIADFCNMSAHKTLNAYTQTAYLCVNNTRMMAKVDNALKLLGTTSPNYVFLQQLEVAAKQLKNSSVDYLRLYDNIVQFKKNIPCLANDDFTRLVVDCYALSTTGKKLTEQLIKNRIMPEKYDDRYVVFILTPRVTLDMLLRLQKVILYNRV